MAEFLRSASIQAAVGRGREPADATAAGSTGHLGSGFAFWAHKPGALPQAPAPGALAPCRESRRRQPFATHPVWSASVIHGGSAEQLARPVHCGRAI